MVDTNRGLLIMASLSREQQHLLGDVLQMLTVRQLYDIAQAIGEIRDRGYGRVSLVINAKNEEPLMEVTVRSRLPRA